MAAACDAGVTKRLGNTSALRGAPPLILPLSIFMLPACREEGVPRSVWRTHLHHTTLRTHARKQAKTGKLGVEDINNIYRHGGTVAAAGGAQTPRLAASYATPLGARRHPYLMAQPLLAACRHASRDINGMAAEQADSVHGMGTILRIPLFGRYQHVVYHVTATPSAKMVAGAMPGRVAWQGPLGSISTSPASSDMRALGQEEGRFETPVPFLIPAFSARLEEDGKTDMASCGLLMVAGPGMAGGGGAGYLVAGSPGNKEATLSRASHKQTLAAGGIPLSRAASLPAVA